MTEAELLFTDILNCDRPALYLNRDTVLSPEKYSFVSAALKRRISGEPLQYILGKTEFMGLQFKVTPQVFIPRPETEILVEIVIKQSFVPACRTGRVRRSSFALSILELGTGSGCIAVSLAKFLPRAKITATDISDGALGVAKENAELNYVADKINFTRGDLFTIYGLRFTNYDLIISNPPYIRTSEIDRLQPEVRCQPRVALDGGRDGLDFYRRIITGAPPYLKTGGLLVLELGFGQAGALRDMVCDSGDFKVLELIRDYNRIERVMVLRKNG